MSLSAQPDNHALQEQLKESLEKIRQDATLVDNPEANDRAQAGIDILQRADFSSSSEALAEIITATVPAVQAVEVLPPMVAPTSDEAIDAELLEIFLLEAEEVLGTVLQTLPDSRNQPHNQEHLTTLRRSFHTLKGSGRMVGLVAFGEAAWSIEQVLNLRLSESRGGDHELYALLDKAVVVLGDWVQDLTQTGRSNRTPDALVRAAERVKAGGQFVYEEEAASETPAAEQAAAATPVPFVSEFDLPPLPEIHQQESGEASVSDAQAEEVVVPSDLPLVEELPMSDADMAMFAVPGSRDELIASANELSASDNLPALDMDTGNANSADIGDIAEAPGPAAVADFVEPVSEVDTIKVDEITEADKASEVSEAVEALTQENADTDLLADVQLLSEDEFAQQDLMSEAVVLSELEAVDEQTETAHLAPPPATPAIAEVIEFPTMHAPEVRVNDNVKRIGDLEISVPLHNIYLAETDELVRVLAHDISEWRHEPDREVSVQSVHAAHSLAGSSATVGFMSLHEVAHALEKVLQFLMRRPVHLQLHEYDTLEQTIERLKAMLQQFALGDMPADEPHYVRVLDNLRRDIELRSQMAELSDTQDLPSTSPDVLPVAELELPHADAFADISALEDSDSALIPELDHVIDSVVDMQPAATQDVLILAAAAQPVASLAGTSAESELAADPSLAIRDELDADLLPVFLEEGRDMFPQMGTALRGWQEQGSSIAAPQSVLRLLHTLKGSARMAGAMNLGQHLHDMETRIENIMHLGTPEPLALEDLLIRYDQAQHMFELLQNPSAAAPAATQVAEAPVGDMTPVAAAHAASSGPVVLSPLMPVPSVNPAMPAPLANRAVAPSAAVPAPLVRVRADILDRLVNQAGEVSISRSKLETEVGTLKQSLSELTDNVSRLRDQLREIEMQAETQITSRMALSGDREFDPLEFDRFTRLQELTRMMAESVNDVGSVHQNLSRTLDSAVGDLSIQARLTRDLQQDLMRVRMVQFASISERLFRVTRQAAKEVDKRVNLDIRGSAVEIDRGVLEKMTGPFEHLLRNAIVHGVETRDARRAAGKNETGELLVEVRQEGNEVVIQFSDDGQGLNVGRIRDKAQRIGLLTNEAPLSDDEVTDLIFHPGFSTAEEITELAGRGVGMDVVRSEAAALGGRVTTWTEPGKGTQFTIRLPLTLAVTQVVLISTGGLTYALPSGLVEQVQQLKTNALAAAYNEGAVIWQGQRVPMHYLSSLLGNKQASPVSQHYSPLLILKSGNDRVAVHVDEIMGNREVVVKNIGPQLSRMIGIAGATVLGSGDIVLILNPVPLAQRAALENIRAPRIMATDVPEAMGAVAEMSAHEPSSPKSGPVQGLRTQNIVMVVDDSLTVRRVTQRLLTREGYQVVLAKDGVDALEHLQSITPDVMLVDIEMPRMDGFDLTRNVRGDERTRHVPIIMITSRTAGKHRNYALELGVNEYLGKPYQEDQLLGLIAGFVKKDVTVS
ncbi:histidine kinase [Noviherbaspirillum sp. Root189]|nr:histidine kinase [Noviherbaspirillum sp. Root189]